MSRHQRLMTTLLTVNAILLSGLLWVQVASRPLFAREAAAQQRNLPNAGAQRDVMTKLLNEIRKSSDATYKILKSGQIKVVVTQPTRKK